MVTPSIAAAITGIESRPDRAERPEPSIPCLPKRTATYTLFSGRPGAAIDAAWVRGNKP
jgi:hypothetical protein